jgi:hypothetical protein
MKQFIFVEVMHSDGDDTQAQDGAARDECLDLLEIVSCCNMNLFT